jgi:hypothetical protein
MSERPEERGFEGLEFLGDDFGHIFHSILLTGGCSRVTVPLLPRSPRAWAVMLVAGR